MAKKLSKVKLTSIILSACLLALAIAIPYAIKTYAPQNAANNNQSETRNSEDTQSVSSKTLTPNKRTIEKAFGAQHYKLDNGLEIITIPNHRAPVVTHMLWYKVGAADETAGQSGIAHFLEHLMFKGSTTITGTPLAPGEFSETVRSLGGQDNAFTGQDYTAYFQTIAKEHLKTVMSMEAGRMRSLNPPLDQVESERLVILEERNQRTDNSPKARFYEHMNAAHYINHPYGVPIIGWRHEMETLDWDIAKAFYDQFYRPDNAILIISGDVTGDEVLKLAKETYGLIPLQEGQAPKRSRTSLPPLPASVQITLRHETIKQPQIALTLSAPSFTSNKNEALALQVLTEYLSGSTSAKLYKSLVVDQKLATSISMSYNGSALNNTDISIYATPAQGITPDDLKAAIFSVITATDDIIQADLDNAIKRLQNAAIFARDSLRSPAYIIGQGLTTGTPLEAIEYWPRDIAAVTIQDIKQAAAKYLSPSANRMTYGVLLPPHEVHPPAEAPEAPDAPTETPQTEAK